MNKVMVYGIAGVASLAVLALINAKARQEVAEQPRGPNYLVYNLPYTRNQGDPFAVGAGGAGDGSGDGTGTCRLCRVFDQNELLSPIRAALAKFGQDTYQQAQQYTAAVNDYMQKQYGNWLQ